MRPILVLNGSTRVDQLEADNPFAWVGSTHKVPVGEEGVLHCPVWAYPLPELRWSRDGTPISEQSTAPAEV